MRNGLSSALDESRGSGHIIDDAQISLARKGGDAFDLHAGLARGHERPELDIADIDLASTNELDGIAAALAVLNLDIEAVALLSRIPSYQPPENCRDGTSLHVRLSSCIGTNTM